MPTAWSALPEYFKLVLSDLDVHAPGLPLDENAVDANTLGAERSSILRDPCTSVTGISDLNDGTDAKWFN
jgi:hypothetical protein